MKGFKDLQEHRPELFKALMQLMSTLETKNSLDEKTRNLIIVSTQTALQNVPAVKSHALAAKNSGATKDEIIDAILTILPAVGIPPILKVLPEILEVLGE